MSKTIGTGIRMTPAQADKLNSLARQLSVSRNHVIGILIDGAAVESRPAIKVSFENANSRGASVSQAERATAVVA